MIKGKQYFGASTSPLRKDNKHGLTCLTTRLGYTSFRTSCNHIISYLKTTRVDEVRERFHLFLKYTQKGNVLRTASPVLMMAVERLTV